MLLWIIIIIIIILSGPKFRIFDFKVPAWTCFAVTNQIKFALILYR